MRILHIGVCAQDGGSLPTAFIKNCTEYRHIFTGDSNRNDKAIQVAMSFQPHFVFMQLQAPNVITTQTVRTLRNLGCWVMNWSGDVRSPLPGWYYDMASVVNMSCFSNMVDVNLIRAAGYPAEYLEIGYDPEIYKPEGESIPCEPVVFMANNYINAFPLSQYRVEIVNHLKRSFGDNFGVYGNGWGRQENFNHSQFEEAKKYRGAKIALNISHFDYERYSSDRLQRILGTGVMCISHHYKGIEQDYQVGKHLVTFTDANDLTEKIKYYLSHEEERKAIARAGQEHARNTNTFDHYVKNMIKITGL